MKIIAPASKPQEMFLNTPDWVDICFYGGQAGGGKTFAGLLHHLKYVHDPLYRGLTLRRTTPMLLKPGAVWDEAKTLFREIDPKCQIKIKDMKFVMSTKGEVSFSHFERVDDTDNFQGAQISSCVMEELCQFEESQFNYILSRLRTKANMKPNMRATMNPDPDSWVRKWVDWYLYPEGHEFFGRPDPEKQGLIRWFVRQDNELYWGDTQEEMLERYPDSTPLSFRFISASVYDNPYVEKSYIAFLQGLPRIEKEILLYGNWEAREESSTFFNRMWIEEIPFIEEKIVATVRAFDFAGTLKSDSNPSPDYTVSVRMRKTASGKYIIDDVQRCRIRFGDWDEFVLRCAANDPINTTYVIPQDPGVAAKRATSEQVARLINNGLYVQKLDTNKSKLERFRPFSAMSQNSMVQFVKNCGNDLENKISNDNGFVYKELEAFTGERKRGENGHDDIVDTISDAYYKLSVIQNLPAMGAGLKAMANITKTKHAFAN